VRNECRDHFSIRKENNIKAEKRATKKDTPKSCDAHIFVSHTREYEAQAYRWLFWRNVFFSLTPSKTKRMFSFLFYIIISLSASAR
jgi:hypothetical protein